MPAPPEIAQTGAASVSRRHHHGWRQRRRHSSPAPADRQPAPAPAPRPDPTARQMRKIRNLLVMDQVAIGALTALQALVTATMWRRAKSESGRSYTLVNLLVKLCCLSGVLYWPGSLVQHRTVLLILMRVAFCLTPVVRETGAGISLLLERKPQPGLRGCIGDVVRLLTGMRLLPVALQGAFWMLPPTATLATQTVLVFLTSNTAQYCDTQLLQDPLAQQRMEAAVSAVEFVSVIGLVLSPVPPSLFTWQKELSSTVMCHSLVPYTRFLLGVVLPTAVTAVCWRPGEERQPPAQGQAQQQAGRGTGGAAPPAVLPTAGCRLMIMKGIGWSVGLAGRALRRCDQVLHDACTSGLRSSRRAFFWWYAFILSWLWFKLAAGFEVWP